jgi:hypothetical protein
MNISAENNAVLETFVQSPLIYSSDPENIQATSLLDQFESDSDVEFQSSTFQNVNISGKIIHYQKFIF